MSQALTFVVPVRHFENIKRPAHAKELLSRTLQSFVAQTSSNWRCVVVANHGTDLPDMPTNCEVLYVDFPKNTAHERSHANAESFTDAVRLDKGRRVLSGMLHAADSDYYMTVDDDDFVHKGLCQFVEENNGKHGWYISDGYIWSEGSSIAIKYENFSMLCGTSHIIRKDLFELSSSLEDMPIERIKNDFGSHTQMQKKLNRLSKSLDRLPFFGAVYRVGHTNSHSGSSNIWTEYFLNKTILANPKQLYWNLCRVKWVTNTFKMDFFGKS